MSSVDRKNEASKKGKRKFSYIPKFDGGTDYWVSQGRKFCEFCKCSIADNKASVQFHENGKKHKDNVAKRLTEMQKKATKEAKDAADLDKEMKKMEEAALKAYLLNDVKSNGDFTSQLIQSGAVTLSLPDSKQDSTTNTQTKKKSCQKTSVKKWMEAVSEEGRTYYWNIDTGESVWEKPTSGCISLLDQGKLESSKVIKEAKKTKKPKKQGKVVNLKSKEKLNMIKGEEKERIDLKTPAFQSQPYGTWQRVEVVQKEPVDLQLPEQELIRISVPKIREESEKKFKDKTSTVGFTSFTQGDTTFKKRKLASGSKQNLRQRFDDD